jgi:hypothetical protein
MEKNNILIFSFLFIFVLILIYIYVRLQNVVSEFKSIVIIILYIESIFELIGIFL